MGDRRGKSTGTVQRTSVPDLKKTSKPDLAERLGSIVRRAAEMSQPRPGMVVSSGDRDYTFERRSPASLSNLSSQAAYSVSAKVWLARPSLRRAQQSRHS